MSERLLKKGKRLVAFFRRSERVPEFMPKKTPEEVDAYKTKLREKIAPSMPEVDGEILSELRKFERVRIETPFGDTKMSRSPLSSVLEPHIRSALEDYADLLVKEVSDGTNHGEHHQMESFFLKGSLKELKDEQDLAKDSLTSLMKKKLYTDGTVFDTTSTVFRSGTEDEEHFQIPALPSDGDKPVLKIQSDAQHWKTPVEPGFKNRHFFAVINGRLVPLIKFKKP